MNDANLTLTKRCLQVSILFGFLMMGQGCTTIPGSNKLGMSNGIPSKSVGAQVDKTRSQALLESGIQYIKEDELEKAQQVFNTALKFDIKNSALHFFNAFTYQLRSDRGDPESFKLAEAGYKTVLKLDPGLDIAYAQLGHLYRSASNFQLAQKNYALAIDSNPLHAEDSLYFFATTSLLIGDSKSSAWAVDKLEKLGWSDSRLVRLKAFQAAIVNKPKLAGSYLQTYLDLEDSERDKKYVSTRIEQLIAAGSSSDILLASAEPTEAVEPSALAVNDEESSSTVPVDEANWFTCDKDPAPITSGNTSIAPATDATGGDEDFVRYALPKPCGAKRPPAAIIEVTMIRTEEKDTQTYGINLLEGLKVTAQGYTSTPGGSGGGFRRARVLSNEGTIVDDLTGGLLSYNINIANSLYEKNEVVARPTLSAIDRLPSVFFSGSNLSVQVGNANTGYSLADKQVGISLSVTPTFVNDTSLLLSIRAARSFTEPTTSTADNPIKLTQTRNTVSANAVVNYGETFILNGLIEREKDKEQTGTPILQEIPILQYFFKRSITIDYNRQILTLVTVRKLVDSEQEVAKAKNKSGLISFHKLSSEIDHFLDLQNSKPVLDEVLASLSKDNGLYRRLRARDLIQESQSHHDLVERVINDAASLLYY